MRPCPRTASDRRKRERIAADRPGARRSGAPVRDPVPGASRKQAYKKPPARLLAAAARQLATRGVLPLVVYGPGEEAEAEAVVRESPARRTPPTDLHVPHALRSANHHSWGDSGPLHLACAVGCPVHGSVRSDRSRRERALGSAEHRAPSGGQGLHRDLETRSQAPGGFDGLGEDEVRAAVDRLVSRDVPVLGTEIPR